MWYMNVHYVETMCIMPSHFLLLSHNSYDSKPTFVQLEYFQPFSCNSSIV